MSLRPTVFTPPAGYSRIKVVRSLDELISTPLDKYEDDVYELAGNLSGATGLDYSKKKNRVIFPKDERLLRVLGIEEEKTSDVAIRKGVPRNTSE